MKKENPKLKVEVRTIKGRKVKVLRRQGILPATIYGDAFEPVSIQMSAKELGVIFGHVGESGLVDLSLDGKDIPVLFRNPQYHPVGGELIHLDCYKVNLKEKITTTVPIELVGEAPIVRTGMILVPVTEEVEVEALPADLPEKIEVDISGLETLESQITVADLVVDRSKVEIKTAGEQLVVKIEEPKVEEEPVVTEEVAPSEVPATEQKAPEEGGVTTEEKKEEKSNA